MARVKPPHQAFEDRQLFLRGGWIAARAVLPGYQVDQMDYLICENAYLLPDTGGFGVAVHGRTLFSCPATSQANYVSH